MVHSSYERVPSAWYSHPVLVFVFLVSAPGIGGYLSNVHNGTGWNGFSERPYINPWNFSIVPSWLISYTFMGFASFLLWYKNGGSFHASRFTFTFYAFHLMVYFCWPRILTEAKMLGQPLPAAAMMWTLILITMYLFELIDCFAGLLMLPNFAWFTIASFFNYFDSLPVNSLRDTMDQLGRQGFSG